MSNNVSIALLVGLILLTIAFSAIGGPGESDRKALQLYADKQGIKILAIRKWRLRSLLDLRTYLRGSMAGDYFIIFTVDDLGVNRRIKLQVEEGWPIQGQVIVRQSIVIRPDQVPPPKG